MAHYISSAALITSNIGANVIILNIRRNPGVIKINKSTIIIAL